jgi:hypothetical protein
MSVTVMDVAHVGVDVGVVLVFVRVSVGLGCSGSGCVLVLVLVVVVMHVGMIVPEQLVSMKMGVSFSAHHHNSESHQRGTCDLGNTEPLIENGH